MRILRRWIGPGLVVLVAVLVTYLAVDAAVTMARGDDCPLPALRSEVEHSEQVGEDWLPPRVRCRRFVLNSLDGSTVRDGRQGDEVVVEEDRWRIYLPLGVLPLSVLGARRLRRH